MNREFPMNVESGSVSNFRSEAISAFLTPCSHCILNLKVVVKQWMIKGFQSKLNGKADFLKLSSLFLSSSLLSIISHFLFYDPHFLFGSTKAR